MATNKCLVKYPVSKMEDSLWVGNFCAINELKENRHSYGSDLMKSVYTCKRKHFCYCWSYRFQKSLKNN